MKRIYKSLFAIFVLVFAANISAQTAKPPSLTLPNAKDSIKFMAVGDTGTGSLQQRELALVMNDYRKLFAFDFAIMVGDNMYGGEKEADFKKKFQEPYRELIDGGVKFFASLGNHDESNQRFYDLFNMDGEEFYRFKKGGAAFYAVNSNYLDKRQIKWLTDEFAKDDAEWKIAFMHHPPYSSGAKHGSSDGVREVLEPLFVKHGVDVVFTGHEHFYERIKPQQGITYFITGAGGKLRKGDIKDNSPLTAKAFDADMSFMLVEIVKEVMHFQVISRAGETVDSGTIERRKK